MGFIEFIKYAAAMIGGTLAYVFGGWDGLLVVLVTFMAIDYTTGVMCAILEKSLSSEVGFRGLCRKVLILLLVGVGHLLDVAVLGGGAALRTAVIAFYTANEGVSIIENAARLGLPIPKKLRKALAQLKEKTEEDGDDVDE